jgi:uncharacterized protein
MSKILTKRDFLKIALTGTSAAILPALSFGKNNRLSIPGERLQDKKILYRTLGNTGMKVPIIGSGILPVNNINLCRKIFGSGMTNIDSAWEYHEGKNDEMVGKMLKEFGRDNYVVSTKVLLPQDQKTGLYTKKATTDAFLAQLDVSLSRMGIDHVDIVYLHKPSNRASVLNEEMLNGLRKAKESGKARFAGISSHSNQVEVLDAAIESKFYEVALVGYNYRADAIVKPAIERATANGLGIVAMKVFAGGNTNEWWESNAVSKTSALKWVLNNENIHTAIVTMRSYDDLDMFLPLLQDITISDDERNSLQALKEKPGLYCYGCGQCLAQCPENLPVPDMMRAFMYAYGYKNANKAKRVVDQLSLSSELCNHCQTCKVNCMAGFDIKEKVRDIARLKDIPIGFLSC